MFAEVVSRTEGDHQMSGYAGTYLGKWGKGLMTFAVLFGNFGAILVYMIGIGDFGFELLGDSLGGTPFLYSSLFFIIASIAILVGLGVVVTFERIMIVMILIIVGLFVALGAPEVQVQNLVYTDFSNILVPYGVLLFAFGGVSAIPEMRRYTKGSKDLPYGILIGTGFAFVVYVLFATSVVGITGTNTSEEAIMGLSQYLGPGIVALGALLGVFTMGTSFLTLGIITKNILVKDYSLHPVLAWVITCFVPYAIYMLGLTSFIQVIAIVGSVTGGLFGIMVIAMFVKARKNGKKSPQFNVWVPKFVVYGLILVFALGIFSEVVNLIIQ